ncbi:MAG: GDP-L-fucose synthase [Bacteroidales bacterium]|nr:GDP-L-fucose synthase [Bacteroidales bacterium]
MNHNSKIYIAGHRGMVGSAIVRCLERKGYTNLVLRSHAELDLTDQAAVAAFFQEQKPEYVFLAAATVGGIMANYIYRAQFIYDNLMIQNNVIHQSYIHGVKKLLFLGSSCIYPKYASQPIDEGQLLKGMLEYTNEPYAIAKIAGIKMCEAYHDQYDCNFISVMPTNLYGPNDNYDLENSHVLPALIRKIYLARCLEKGDMEAIRRDLVSQQSAVNSQQSAVNSQQSAVNSQQSAVSSQQSAVNSQQSAVSSQQSAVNSQQSAEEVIAILSNYDIRKDPRGNVTLTLWGTGSPKREFLHVDDLAEATLFVMNKIHVDDIRTEYRDMAGFASETISHLNIGSGKDLTIKELSVIVKDIVGFQGEILFDSSRPSGTPRKVLDVSKIKSLGWRPVIDLRKGIRAVFEDYVERNI